MFPPAKSEPGGKKYHNDQKKKTKFQGAGKRRQRACGANEITKVKGGFCGQLC